MWLVAALVACIAVGVGGCRPDYVREFNREFTELEKDRDELMWQINVLELEVEAAISAISVKPVSGILATYLFLSVWKTDVAKIKVQVGELRKRAYWLPDYSQTSEIKQDVIEGFDALEKWCDSSYRMFSAIQSVPKTVLETSDFGELDEAIVMKIRRVGDEWDACQLNWEGAEVSFAASRAKMDTLLEYNKGVSPWLVGVGVVVFLLIIIVTVYVVRKGYL